MKKIIIGLLVLIVVGAVVWILVVNGGMNPQEVAGSFFTSMKDGKFEIAHGYLAPELGVIPVTKFQESMSPFQLVSGITTEAAVVNGDVASVRTALTVAGEQKEIEVKLRQYDGQWKIFDLVFDE